MGLCLASWRGWLEELTQQNLCPQPGVIRDMRTVADLLRD
jgi:hypothetical protein